MDAKTSRTLNIRLWVAQAGGPAEFAAKYGDGRWVASQVSQWISESHPKGIGHALARAIEIRLGKAVGSMDASPASIRETESHFATPDPDILYESLTLLFFDEQMAGAYPPRAQATRLAELYRRVADDGGRLTLAHNNAFVEEVQARTRGSDERVSDRQRRHAGVRR